MKTIRTLKFIVNGQIITLDPSCDFSGLVPGTNSYLRAEFTFSPEWNGCVKVASFWSALGREYPPEVLRDGNSCIIPAEALEKRIFKIKVIGRNGGTMLSTDKVAVYQNGGKK